MDPRDRFTGLADIYARARPEYPDEAIDHVVSRAGLTDRSIIADVGCGTGISSRIFARRGMLVVGIEPNAEMRRKAEAGSSLASLPNLSFAEGQAEATGLAGESVDAVVSAQAFHWFDAARALEEFHRILKPGGWVVLMWNERDETDPVMRGYGDALRATTDTSVEVKRQSAGQPLLDSRLFHDSRKDFFANQQKVDEKGLLERAFSASYAPRREPEATILGEGLKELFARHQINGTVSLRYQTSVFTACKAPETA